MDGARSAATETVHQPRSSTPSSSQNTDEGRFPPGTLLAQRYFRGDRAGIKALNAALGELTLTFSRKNLDWYIGQQHEKQNALPAAEVDRLLAEQETALLQTIAPELLPDESTSEDSPPVIVAPIERERIARRPIWDRTGGARSTRSAAWPPSSKRKRGPKADIENHAKVAKIIRSYGDTWTADKNLSEICEALDREEVPIPKTWPTRNPPSRSWSAESFTP